MPAPNLYPDFQTFLFPSFDNGNVDFIKFPIGASPGQGEVLKFPFVRPNTAENAAKSGAVRLNSEGNYEELAAHDPVWDFRNGCPVLSMAPQKKSTLAPSFGEQTYGADVTRFGRTFKTITMTNLSKEFYEALNVFPLNDFALYQAVVKYPNTSYKTVFAPEKKNDAVTYHRVTLNYNGTLNSDPGGIYHASGVEPLQDGYRRYWIIFKPLNNTSACRGRAYPDTAFAGAYIEYGMWNITQGQQLTPWISAPNITRSSSSFSKTGLILAGVLSQTEGCILLKAKSNLSFTGVSANADLISLKKDPANQLRIRGNSGDRFVEGLGFGGANPQIPFGENKILLLNWGEDRIELYADGEPLGAEDIPNLTGIDSAEFFSPFYYEIEMIGFGKYKLAQEQCISHSTIY